jgi:hypothetical protein
MNNKVSASGSGEPLVYYFIHCCRATIIMSERLLYNRKWDIFSSISIMARTSNFLMRWWCMLCSMTNTKGWRLILLLHWNLNQRCTGVHWSIRTYHPDSALEAGTVTITTDIYTSVSSRHRGSCKHYVWKR